MPLNKDILGLALYERLKDFNNKTPDEIGDPEEARKALWHAVADEFITHFKQFALVKTTGTAAAQTGTIS